MTGFIAVARPGGEAIDDAFFNRLARAIQYRGRGETRTWRDEGIALASTEAVPLDDRYAAAVDARIDEGADGTSALLHPERLIGDFSYAVWDRVERTLFCARDRFGIRPLCYARLGETWIVSNDLSAVASIGELTRDLDEVAVADFLLRGIQQDPERSFFARIRRVPPAHALTIDRGGARLTRYWSLPVLPSPVSIGEREAVERFRALLFQAVRDRARDARVVVSMSGGLDSTSIAAALADLRGRDAIAAETTALTGAIAGDPEREPAAAAAKALRIPHVIFRSDAHPPFDCGGVEPPGHPFRASALAYAAVAASHGDIYMTGEAGDSILYTSHRYFVDLLRRLRWIRFAREAIVFAATRRKWPPLGLRAPLQRALGASAWQPAYPSWLRPEFEQHVGARERWMRFAEPSFEHPFRPEAYVHVTSPYWPAMFQGLDPSEVRQPIVPAAPYLDVRLVEFVFSLPPMPHFADKDILRNAMRGLLPDAIRLRRKTPLAHDVAEAVPDERRFEILAGAPEIDPFVDRAILTRQIREQRLESFTRFQADLAVLLAGWLVRRREQRA